METIFGGLIGLDGPYEYESRLFREFFADSLLALGIAGVAVLAFLVFRPLAQRQTVAPEDRRRAEDLARRLRIGHARLLRPPRRQEPVLLVRRPGDGRLPTSRVCRLRRPDRRAGVGPAGRRRVRGLLPRARVAGWAYLAVRESDVPLYEARGMKAVYLGDEAIIRRDRIDIHGPGMKKLRGRAHVARDHTFALMRESGRA